MKAQFSLTALIAAGLILQGCGHEGPNTDSRGGPQLAKQTDSSNGGSKSATPTPQGKASQASSGQQDANRIPANQPAPIPTKALNEPTPAVQAQASPQHSLGQKAIASHKLQHLRPIERSDYAPSQAIADVDSRAIEGIRNAVSKANDADSHAVDAGNGARPAQQAISSIGNVEQTVAKIDQYYPAAQTEIRFRHGQTALSTKDKEALDEMANALKEQRGYIIEIQSFPAGGSETAIQNSRQMVETIVGHLILNNQVPAYRIYTVGMGEAALEVDGKMVSTDGGRVEVNLLKSSLGDVGSSATANSSGSTGDVTGAVTTVAPASHQTGQPAKPAYQPSDTGATIGKPSSSKPPQH